MGAWRLGSRTGSADGAPLPHGHVLLPPGAPQLVGGDGAQLAQVAAHDQLQVTRADVVRALQKLDDGTYGECDVCGRAIPEGRLEARPWAVLCVEDAAKQ